MPTASKMVSLSIRWPLARKLTRTVTVPIHHSMNYLTASFRVTSAVSFLSLPAILRQTSQCQFGTNYGNWNFG
jgi:hypothetical protein